MCHIIKFNKWDDSWDQNEILLKKKTNDKSESYENTNDQNENIP